MPRMTGGCRVDGQTKFIPRNVFAKFRTIFAKKHELLTLHIFDMSVLFSACSMLIIFYVRVYVNICVQVFFLVETIFLVHLIVIKVSCGT